MDCWGHLQCCRRKCFLQRCKGLEPIESAIGHPLQQPSLCFQGRTRGTCTERGWLQGTLLIWIMTCCQVDDAMHSTSDSNPHSLLQHCSTECWSRPRTITCSVLVASQWRPCDCSGLENRPVVDKCMRPCLGNRLCPNSSASPAELDTEAAGKTLSKLKVINCHCHCCASSPGHLQAVGTVAAKPTRAICVAAHSIVCSLQCTRVGCLEL